MIKNSETECLVFKSYSRKNGTCILGCSNLKKSIFDVKILSTKSVWEQINGQENILLTQTFVQKAPILISKWIVVSTSKIKITSILGCRPCIMNAQNMAKSDFWEKFFTAENAGNMPEIAVFADFYGTFSL